LPIYRAFQRDRGLLSSAVYLDSSFAIRAVLSDQPYHAECQEFGDHLRNPKFLVVYSEYLLMDAWNGLVNTFVAAAWEDHKQRHHDYGLSLRDFRKSQPALLKTLGQTIIGAYQGVTALLHSFRHSETELTAAIRQRAMEHMLSLGLYPADAVHVATAESARISDLLTFDSDYAVLPVQFSVWNPDGITKRIERTGR
jgi:predicted nucleic acid-binding protein